MGEGEGGGVFCAVWHLALKAKGITLLEIFFPIH